MLQQKIDEDLKEAMKSGNDMARSTLRMLISQLRNKEIELGKKGSGLSDEEIMNVISSEVKRRTDAIEGYEKGGRAEAAAREQSEKTLLEAYLPPQLSDAELTILVKESIQETGAASELDFPRVMKTLMPRVRGKASGDRVSQAVKRELANHAHGHQ